MKSADLTLSLPASMQITVPDSVDPDAVVREELLSWRVQPDEGAVYFLALVTGDRESVEQGAAAVDEVRRAEFATVDDDTFYAYVCMELRAIDNALIAAFEIPGMVIVPPVVYTDVETVRVTVLGEESALSGLLDAIPEEVSATVDRVSDHGRLGGSLAGRLTRRQFEAVEVASALGYYEVPREGSLADVAAELDCSESAASTLLRSAEQALVDAALAK